jgi:hypothetical protein
LEVYTLLVLQWWFCNKLGFADYGGFAKLGGKGVVYGLLISREIWPTFFILKCEHTKKKQWFRAMGIHSRG